MIFLLVALAAVVAAPMAGALLVTFASLREDAAHSLAGRPPGVLTAAARRLLRLRAGSVPDVSELLRPRVPRQRVAPADEEVRTLTMPRS